MQNSSKMNCFKTKTLRKHHKANRTLRFRIVVFGLQVVKKPLFIGASHVTIIPQRIFATILQRFIEKSSLWAVAIVPFGL